MTDIGMLVWLMLLVLVARQVLRPVRYHPAILGDPLSMLMGGGTSGGGGGNPYLFMSPAALYVNDPAGYQQLVNANSWLPQLNSPGFFDSIAGVPLNVPSSAPASSSVSSLPLAPGPSAGSAPSPYLGPATGSNPAPVIGSAAPAASVVRR